MKRLMIWLLWPVATLWVKIAPRLSRSWHHVCLRCGVRHLDTSVVVQGPVELHGTGHISIAAQTLLYRDLFLETRSEGLIDIGAGCVLSRGVHISSRTQVKLGDGCMVGEYTSIRDANHRYGPDLVIRDSGFESAPITLGRQVWLGARCTVLAGVSIGDHAVIGAGSVVTRSIPAYAVAVGVPARVLHLQTD